MRYSTPIQTKTTKYFEKKLNVMLNLLKLTNFPRLKAYTHNILPVSRILANTVDFSTSTPGCDSFIFLGEIMRSSLLVFFSFGLVLQLQGKNRIAAWSTRRKRFLSNLISERENDIHKNIISTDT